MGFATDSAISRDGDGRYTAEIRPGWDIAGHANGGYLLAITARAMIDAAERPDPVSITAHYLAPGQPGPVSVATEVIKRGRTFTTVSAALRAGDRHLLQTLGTFGDVTTSGGPERVDATPPDLPPLEQCVPIEPTETFPPPFMGRVEMRLHPDDAGFTSGAPSGEPRVRGWFRLRDGEEIDSIGLLQAADAFPPTVFNARLPVAWTPTVELTAHVRARPARGWLRCAFTTRFVTAGFLEEDGVIWDSTDRLVAQSRQLALVARR